MPKTNLDILEDLLYKVGKMSEDDVSVTEFETFNTLLEISEAHHREQVGLWLNSISMLGLWKGEKNNG